MEKKVIGNERSRPWPISQRLTNSIEEPIGTMVVPTHDTLSMKMQSTGNCASCYRSGLALDNAKGSFEPRRQWWIERGCIAKKTCFVGCNGG